MLLLEDIDRVNYFYSSITCYGRPM